MTSMEERLGKLEKRISEIERKIDLLLNFVMNEFYGEEEFSEFPEIEIEKKELN